MRPSRRTTFRSEPYRLLIDRVGEGGLADALLAKWLADPDGGAHWVELADKVYRAEGEPPKEARGRMEYEATAKELQVLQAVARGKKQADVAVELKLSIDTIKTHLKRLRIKWGMRGSTLVALVDEGRRRGVIQ